MNESVNRVKVRGVFYGFDQSFLEGREQPNTQITITF